MDVRAEKMLEDNPFLSNMELAYRLIFEDIILGRYQIGERLLQDKLSGLYGMSRTPVRDSLLKLETEGYVEKDGSSGFKVKEIDVVDYMEFWEFRRCMETHMAAVAATNITEMQLKKFRKNLEGTKKMGEYGNSLDIFRYDEEFHNLIVEAADNQYFQGAYEHYEAKIRYYRYLFQKQVNSVTIYAGHYRIYKALEKRNESEAKDAMYYHLSFFMKHFRNKVKNK